MSGLRARLRLFLAYPHPRLSLESAELVQTRLSAPCCFLPKIFLQLDSSVENVLQIESLEGNILISPFRAWGAIPLGHSSCGTGSEMPAD